METQKYLNSQNNLRNKNKEEVESTDQKEWIDSIMIHWNYRDIYISSSKLSHYLTQYTHKIVNSLVNMGFPVCATVKVEPKIIEPLFT